MMPEERDRVIIEGATAELVKKHWSWIRDYPRRTRFALVDMIRRLVASEYRRQEAAARSA